VLARLLAQSLRKLVSSAHLRNRDVLDPALEDAKRLIAAGDLMKAEASLRAAARRSPYGAEVYRLLGGVLGANGSIEEARSTLEQALRLEPDNPFALTDLGNAYRIGGRWLDAERCYRRALEVDPGNRAARLGLALADEHCGRAQQAIDALCGLLDPPALAPAIEALVALLDRLGRASEAKRICAEVLAREPGHGAAYAALGFLLLKRELRAAAALEHLERALELGYRDEDVLSNRAIALQDLGRLPEAIAGYDDALSVQPTHQSARFHRSLALLMSGEFGRAWQDYELRLNSEDAAAPPRQLPRWTGEALPSTTLLVHGEQGIGDEIMFASCLPDLLLVCPHVVVTCADKLEPIFRRSFPTIEVIGTSRARELDAVAPLDKATVIAAIGSLPLYFRSSVDRFPQHRGYLQADPDLVAEYRERLQKLGGRPKVGISWRGGTSQTRQAMRTLAKTHLERILAVPGVRFVNLQYDSTENDPEITEATGDGRLTHWPETLTEYDRTAALVCGLDVVVSVCTSLIHLTGALGRPVWVMAPYSPEWRYGIASEGMPWYPSARIYRQREPGHWASVIDAVHARLSALAASRLQPAAGS